MARMTPEARARLEAFKAVKVKHPRLEEVDRVVTQTIEEHGGPGVIGQKFTVSQPDEYSAMEISLSKQLLTVIEALRDIRHMAWGIYGSVSLG